MATDQHYILTLEIVLEPIYDSIAPECCVMLDNTVIFSGMIDKTIKIDHQSNLSRGSHTLCLEYKNKSDRDYSQCIKIKSIKFNNIEDSRFAWIGDYRPRYPEPWATEQQQQGIILSSCLSNIDCLGWEGTWTLAFDVPVFTWIHRVKNLGTIYD